MGDPSGHRFLSRVVPMSKYGNIIDIRERDEGEVVGYHIVTDEGILSIEISNQDCCCEDWGFVASEDTLEEFYESTITDVSVTTTALETIEIPSLYDGDVMFLTLNTSKGSLQFAVYNSHNGYYGHSASIVWNEETLKSGWL